MTNQPITIVQDGTVLVGDRWIVPMDFIDDDIEAGRLIALKGATMQDTFELIPTETHWASEPVW